ncbi:fimbrillin family protein [Alistipes sp. OttesenSCG-928-B03]|nr:fimbrillin family protein [Alistipes sp. OttesenSCG-928-B03]
MRQITTYLSIFILVLGWNGCTQVEQLDRTDYIELGVVLPGSDEASQDATTRGDIIEGVGTQELFRGTMKLYGLYGTNGVHINGDDVTMTVTSSEPYTQNTTYQKLWPADGITQLTFHAITPLPNTTNNNLSVTTSGTTCQIGAYTIKPEAINQTDLMFATTGPQHGGNVSMRFHHALSRITFTVAQSDYPAGSVTVQRVSLRNVMNGLSGTLSNAQTYVWTVPTTPTRSNFSMQVTTPSTGQVVTTTAEYLRPATGSAAYNMFLFPHTNAQFATADLYVEYTVGGNQRTKSVPLASVVADHKWEKGKWINYQISIAPDGVTFDTTVKEWDKAESNWDLRNFELKTSQTEVDITDYNGTRIYFTSNQPNVRVLDEVYEDVYKGVTTSGTKETNTIFNDLARTATVDDPYRFKYDYDAVTGKGSGYLEILLDDAINERGDYVYRLVLAASDNINPDRMLQREIKVNVKQYGTRSNSPMNWSRTGHVGAFWKKDQVGERVIMETNPIQGNAWSAQVTEGTDWLVLSTSPSVDPGLGRTGADSYPAPGDAEHYPVTAFTSKGDAPDGLSVIGRGRIYFRIGTKSTLPTTSNRYGVITVSYRILNSDGVTSYERINYIYVRQGEYADYVFEPTSTIPEYLGEASGEWMFAGQQRGAAAVRFSPYNLTAPAYKSGSGVAAVTLSKNGGVAVDYPSQAGAYFKWTDSDNFDTATGTLVPKRYSYSPNLSVFPTAAEGWTGYAEEFRATNKYVGKYWDNHFNVSETCPPGWRRPNDGKTNGAPAVNAPYYHANDPSGTVPLGMYVDEIKDSELRMSLFFKPDAGDGHRLGVGSEEGETGPEPILTNRIYPSYPYRKGLSFVQNNVTYPLLSYPPQIDQRSDHTRPYDEGGGGNGQGFQDGFYADGFFDRHPKQVESAIWAVKQNTNDVAYRGSLLYNPETKKSIFIPHAGRRNGQNDVQSVGNTAQLWTASSGPYLTWKYQFTAWGFAINVHNVQLRSVQYYFASNIRCVTDSVNPAGQIMPQE